MIGRRAYGENPLQGERHAPGPLVVEPVVGIRRAGDDDGPDGPAHLQGGRAGSAQGQRRNLAGVGGRVGNEEAPRDAFQGLTDDEEGEGVGLQALDGFHETGAYDAQRKK